MFFATITPDKTVKDTIDILSDFYEEDEDEEEISFEISITRNEFEEIIQPYLDKFNIKK